MSLDVINYMLDDFAIKPTKGHEDDAGYDLYTPERLVIRPRSSVVVDTGVHFEIPKGHVGMIKSKSGLNVNSDINSEGVIDSGYTGSVRAKLYNHGDELRIINKGEKITQIVFLPIVTPKLVEVGIFQETERGDHGFGSTGR